MTDEVVDDDVGTKAARHPVRGGIAQVGGTEVVVGEVGDGVLDTHLRFAVGRDRAEFGCLVEQLVAAAAVQAAGGREQESSDAGRLGGLGEAHRARRLMS